MTELVPAEIIIEENQKNVDNAQKNVDNAQKNVDNAKKNKKLILWGILVVLVLIILYVLFGDTYNKYRLNTETRKDLVKEVKGTVPNPLLSETSSNTVGPMTFPSSTSPNSPTPTSPTSSTSASKLRNYLKKIFNSR